MTPTGEAEFHLWATRFHEQYAEGSRLEKEFMLTRTLVLAARRWTSFADGLVRRRTGHSRARWQALSALSYSDGPVSTLELARRMSLRWPTLVRVLKDLEGEGLARRERDDADGRLRLLAITPAGLDLVARVRATLVPARSSILATFTDDEMQIAERVLQKLLNILVAADD